MHRENCLQTRLPPTFAKRKTTAAATGWSHSRRLSICRAALNRVVRPRPASRSRHPRKYRALEPIGIHPQGALCCERRSQKALIGQASPKVFKGIREVLWLVLIIEDTLLLWSLSARAGRELIRGPSESMGKNFDLGFEFVIIAEVNDVVAAGAGTPLTTQALGMDRKQKRCLANSDVRIIKRGFDRIHFGIWLP